jgi:hypothetical protein
VTEVLTEVRAHLRTHFARAGITAEPVSASVTFLGNEPVQVLRFAPDVGPESVAHYVSLGSSRHPMTDGSDPSAILDPLRGPRAEVVVSLYGPSPAGLARSVAVLATAPAVEGLVLEPDALIDLSGPLWRSSSFTAFLLGRSDIADLALTPPLDPVAFLSATPITATEAAWVRLKGAGAMRQAWQADGVDVLDPNRRASQPS